MTKKPSEKNKAWEKDRRDRLNKTFDELAKLLPKYDPSVVWSKIEIIQKAIGFIADLQKKQEEYLKTKDPELFREYEEFVECLNFYQERNAQLTVLLKKAKVALPPVILPQLLIDKPELLPKVDDVCLQKPKRQRNRTKKCEAGAKKNKENEENKEKRTNSTTVDGEKSPEIAENRPSSVAQVEVVVKPTAIITAFTRESSNDTLIQPPSPQNSPPATAKLILQPPIRPPSPQLPPPMPVKPLLLRLLKPHSIRRRKLINKSMFRKCYPHPNRLFQWNTTAVSQRKSIPNPRRGRKKQNFHQEKAAKRLKLSPIPEPIREQSVSPTAAFLLSFPVVTSSMLNGKNVENVENSVSLENLNNFFTTEEYSKFCDQNPDAENKIPTPICSSLPVGSVGKSALSGKPMTSFTVSAITRPSSPKKSMAHCEQATTKRLNEAPWLLENKTSRVTPTTSFDSCYNFTNINPMIGTTSMCSSSVDSSRQQVETLPVACFSSPATELRPSGKMKSINVAPCRSKLNTTGNFFPRYNHSTSMPNVIVKTEGGSTPHSLPPQKGSVSATTSIACKSSSNFVSKISAAPTIIAMSKTGSKPAVNSFYSPTKSFFYDIPPTQNQSATTLNFNLSTTTTSSSADPLISSTTAAKSHTFLSFPSIKSEFPWLPSNTTAFTTPLTPTTSVTTTAACNLNTSFTPFDLASIVCEPLTSTSFTFSLTTAKSSEPTVVEAGNKSNTTNKCNQMNLFVPYEEVQYMPTFTLALTKPSDSQVCPTAWKSEKAKDISEQIFYDCEQSKPQQKSHVNWMTSPTIDFTPAPAALPLPPIDFGNQFPTSANFDFGFGCRKDSYDDDNQFINWSPTKPPNADFSTAYSFENFGSNEAPPNKTVKQIFSVSQLVDQTPPPEGTSMKKSLPKTPVQKSTPIKQTFSNIYSAESLIAKKDSNRLANITTSFYGPDVSNTQTDNGGGYHHNTSNYFYNYPNTQNCSENDYLGASAYSTSSTMKATSALPPAAGTVTAPVIPPFDSATASSTTNYFAHSISSNNNDPYDPTYFPSSNYNHPTAANWNHAAAKGTSVTGYNQNQLPSTVVYGTVEPSCQQNTNVSSNLTNFNLSSICPEIDGKDGPSGW